MKLPIIIISILMLTMSPNVYSMDLAEIPLQKINSPKKNLENFTLFEQKIAAELNQKNWFLRKELSPAVYMARIHKDLPYLIATEKRIEKLSRIKNSYFAQSLSDLINKEGKNHYKKITCDTLTKINLPQETESCMILTNLPPTIKQYVMKQALASIERAYIGMKFENHPHAIDIHTGVNLAATINAHQEKIEIWDLVTGNGWTLPKKATHGLIRFSTNGSHIIAATGRLNEKITTIDIWNSTTKKCINRVTHHHQLLNIFFTNEQLIVFDTAGFLSTYTLNKETQAYTISTSLHVGVKEMNPGLTLEGNYLLSGNVLCKKSSGYFLCMKAIENTGNIHELPKIYTTKTYATLTDVEKKIVTEKIQDIATLFCHKKEDKKTMTWFG